MADEESSGTARAAEATTGDERKLPEGRRAAVGLPAGIRWWETCGGWSSRYALGTF